jgi:hypothetical protein
MMMEKIMANSIPPTNKKICPVRRLHLARLYWIEEETKTQLSIRFGVSIPTVTKFFNQYALDTSRRHLSLDGLQDAYINENDMVVWIEEKVDEAKLEGNEAEGGDDTERSEGKSTSGQSLVPDDDYDAESPWAQLSGNQRKGVALFASVEPNLMAMTVKQKCDLLGITHDTYMKWKKDSNFAQCLIQLRKDEAKMNALLEWTDDMFRRMRTNQGYTQEDRKLMAEAFGITSNGSQINLAVQINAGDSKLKKIF